MGENVNGGFGQTKAVDDARVVECIAMDDGVGREEGRKNADGKLISGGKQDGVLVAEHGREPLLGSPVFRVVAADQARSGTSRRVGVEQAWIGGQAQIIVAAKPEHPSAVEVVIGSLAVGCGRWDACEIVGFQCAKLLSGPELKG